MPSEEVSGPKPHGSEQTKAEMLAEGMVVEFDPGAKYRSDKRVSDQAKPLLPFATLIVEAEEALREVVEMAQPWQALTPGDIADVARVLARLREVIGE
jgi:hypothetical protein